jgi:hypothetical protein
MRSRIGSFWQSESKIFSQIHEAAHRHSGTIFGTLALKTLP